MLETRVFGEIDLAVSMAWANDDTLSFGQPLVLNFQIDNLDSSTASLMTVTYYWSPTAEFDAETATQFDAGHLGTIKAGQLGEIGQDTIKYKELVEFGSGYVFGVINSNSYLVDINPENNISDAIYIELNGGMPHQADLKIDEIWAVDSSLAFDQNLMLRLHVSNDGTADALRAQTTFYWSETDTFDFDTAHRIDADGHGTLKVGEYDANEYESINYSNLARFGTGYVFGVIDAEQTTDEINEDNNVSEAVYVEFEPLVADLSVAHIAADDTTLDLGQSLIIRLHVENQGTDRAQNTSSNFYWSPDDEFDWATAVLLDNDVHGTLNVGEYDSNEYEHISYSSLRDLGSGFVFAVIDAENTIHETNEGNNISDALEFWV